MKLLTRAATAFDEFRATVKNSRFGKYTNATVAIATTLAAASVAVFLTYNFIVLTIADRVVQDWEIAHLQPSMPQDPDVVFVAVNEDTLAQFPYRSPVDRGFLNDLLVSLAAKHPKAIGLDMLFDQPTETAKDNALRHTIATLPVPLVVSYVDDPSIEDKEQRVYLDNFVPLRNRVYATLAADQFGTERWIFPGAHDAAGHYIYGFARGINQRLGVHSSNKPVPIVWHGKPGQAIEGNEVGAFKEYPAHVARFLPPAWFQNKIVLVGSDLTLTDLHRTPYNSSPTAPMMPGTMIFAHQVSQLYHHTPSPLAPWTTNLTLALALAAIGGGLGMLHSRLALRIGAGFSVVVIFWIAGAAIYHYTNTMVGLLSPTLALAMNFTVMDSRSGREARQQKKFIQGVFSRYVSPKVVAEILKDPTKALLGGVRREMSYIFTDVANFTTFSETMDSADLARVLNAYFEGLTQIVLKHDGTFDKFIGDAIFAFFNAPVEQADHSERAVRCALDLDEFCEKFRVERVKENLPFGITRVGVHTGTAVVGNFGSQTNFNYTAQGDSVNMASRLEGLNKMFGTRICVSGPARNECRGLTLRPVGSVVLKGKTVPVDVWEPVREGQMTAAFLARYNTAYDKMKDESPEAQSLFEALAREAPGDPCVAFHLKRLREGDKGVTLVMHEK